MFYAKFQSCKSMPILTSKLCVPKACHTSKYNAAKSDSSKRVELQTGKHF